MITEEEMYSIRSGLVDVRDLANDLGERLQISVHYASTPAINGEVTTRANSVDQESNSDDYDISSSASSTSTNNNNVTRTSVNGDYQTAGYQILPIVRQQQQQQQSPAGLGTRQRLASVSSSRLSSTIVRINKNNHHRHQYQSSAAIANVTPDISRDIVGYASRSVHNFPHQQPPPQQQQQQPEPSSPESDDLTVTEDDVRAIDTCYRGHKTRVFVSNSMANLYASPRSTTRVAPTAPCDSWRLMYTGIPVLLLDTGATKSRSKRQIQILLVEKGTCFTLWKDVIDNLTKYTAQEDLFHVMHLSGDHLCRVGFSFDEAQGAKDFYKCVCMLTADPANISLNSANKSKKFLPKAGGKGAKYRRPSKAEISLPCGFQHVVSVDRQDSAKYFSLKAFIESKRAAKESSSSPHQLQNSIGRWGSTPNVYPQNKMSVFAASCNQLNV